MKRILLRVLSGTPLLFLFVGSKAIAASIKQYDVGASDTEIRVGNIMPYSGPASAYGVVGKTEAAYFRMINDSGGIHGRKINFISLDGAYSPPKTLEMARRLVEKDQVLLLFGTLGTSVNVAIHKYTNGKKVPHLFVGSGGAKWNDPVHYPWTMAWQLDYVSEGRMYAGHILKNMPQARIAILYQNDDLGRDYLKGSKEGLGAKTGAIVAEVSYEVTAPTVDSQIVQLKASGADVFVNVSTPKQAAQAIRRAYDIGWKPLQYLAAPASSVASVFAPAGLEKAIGIINATHFKDPTSPQYARDTAVVEWLAFLKKYYPEGDPKDRGTVYGTLSAETLVHVLRQAGDNLTRENIMKQAASLKDVQLSLGLAGVVLNTSATDFAPFESGQLQRFDGSQWVPFGDVIGR